MECAICLEALENNIYELVCGHSFHSRCLLDGYHRGIQLKCAICRQSAIIESDRTSGSETNVPQASFEGTMQLAFDFNDVHQLIKIFRKTPCRTLKTKINRYSKMRSKYFKCLREYNNVLYSYGLYYHLNQQFTTVSERLKDCHVKLTIICADILMFLTVTM